MQSLQWYMRRLRSMDASEIAWRVRSLVRDQLDLIRIPLGLIPRIRETNIPSISKFRPGFRVTRVTRDVWYSIPADIRDTWEARLIAKANQILQNRLSYFDLEAVDHGLPWNWHRDFSAGKDCPIRISILSDYRDFDTYGDCKLVWEPNRHHQLVVLGRAYVITHDRKYALKVAELLRSWIDSNPYGYGMNWKSPLELGVRLINWIWALDLINDSDVIDDELWYDVVNTVYRMTWDTQRKFSRGSSANNHLIGELAGVYTACCYFPEMPNAQRWRKTSHKLLEREIIAQTYADGCTREHAFNYAFFVIQFFTTTLVVGQAVGDAFTDAYRERLHAMYRFMHDLSSDTGQPPNAGDADDGYVLDLGDLPSCPLPLLAVGEILFDDQQLTFEEPSESAFWLFARDALTSTTPVSKTDSSFYPDSGYFILRSGRQRDVDSPAVSVFFDCAELGYGPIAAHGHADCLSFCLSIDGMPVFIDPGTYDYFSYPEWREYFRQTRAHNTVEINGISQSESLGPFLWGQRAHPNIESFSRSHSRDVVTGSHDGYAPIRHLRTCTLNRRNTTFEILDKFHGLEKYSIRLNFHLAPNLICKIKNQALTIVVGLHEVDLSMSGAELQCPTDTEHTAFGACSHSYHKLERGHAVAAEADLIGCAEVLTTIAIRPLVA